MRIDDALIERAKTFAASHGRSLSHIVADYFAALAPPGPLPHSDARAAELPPQVRHLVGIARARPGPTLTDAEMDDLRLQAIIAKHLHNEIRE